MKSTLAQALHRKPDLGSVLDEAERSFLACSEVVRANGRMTVSLDLGVASCPLGESYLQSLALVRDAVAAYRASAFDPLTRVLHDRIRPVGCSYSDGDEREIDRLFERFKEAKRYYLAALDAGHECGFSARNICDAEIASVKADWTLFAFSACNRRRMELFRQKFVKVRTRGECRARRTGNVKRTPITDGYIRTGKTMVLDGERVPVVRKVECFR